MVAFAVVLIAGQVWLELTIPDYMSEVTRLVQTPGSAMSEVWNAGLMMLLCALGSLVLAVMTGFIAARVAASFAMDLRSGVFNKVQSFSMEEINGFSTAQPDNPSHTNDITQVQMLIAMGIQLIIKAPIMAVWAITKIQSKSWQWTFSTFAAILLLFIIIIVVVSLVMGRFKRIQFLIDNLNNVTRENLTGIRVVKAYNAENYQEEKFEGANEALTNNNLVANRIMAIMMPGMNIILNGLTLAIYWIGAWLINGIAITGMDAINDRIGIFSDMVVFSSYAMQLVMSFVMLVVIFIMSPRECLVSANRINEILETEAKIKDGSKTEGLPGVEGELEFRNVSFKYPDAEDYVLKNISFTAKRGQTVAFIGSTGSGKTTLINLIPRFYDATEGQVLVDGVDVREYKLEALHETSWDMCPSAQCCFPGQSAQMWLMGESKNTEQSGEEEVKSAVRIAQGAEFVENMPGGYDGAVAQGGANLSGGQKQRVAIARAVYTKPGDIHF